jgi:hypothetical protein
VDRTTRATLFVYLSVNAVASQQKNYHIIEKRKRRRSTEAPLLAFETVVRDAGRNAARHQQYCLNQYATSHIDRIKYPQLSQDVID